MLGKIKKRIWAIVISGEKIIYSLTFVIITPLIVLTIYVFSGKVNLAPGLEFIDHHVHSFIPNHTLSIKKLTTKISFKNTLLLEIVTNDIYCNNISKPNLFHRVEEAKLVISLFHLLKGQLLIMPEYIRNTDINLDYEELQSSPLSPGKGFDREQIAKKIIQIINSLFIYSNILHYGSDITNIQANLHYDNGNVLKIKLLKQFLFKSDIEEDGNKFVANDDKFQKFISKSYFSIDGYLANVITDCSQYKDSKKIVCDANFENLPLGEIIKFVGNKKIITFNHDFRIDIKTKINIEYSLFRSRLDIEYEIFNQNKILFQTNYLKGENFSADLLKISGEINDNFSHYSVKTFKSDFEEIGVITKLNLKRISKKGYRFSFCADNVNYYNVHNIANLILQQYKVESDILNQITTHVLYAGKADLCGIIEFNNKSLLDLRLDINVKDFGVNLSYLNQSIIDNFDGNINVNLQRTIITTKNGELIYRDGDKDIIKNVKVGIHYLSNKPLSIAVELDEKNMKIKSILDNYYHLLAEGILYLRRLDNITIDENLMGNVKGKLTIVKPQAINFDNNVSFQGAMEFIDEGEKIIYLTANKKMGERKINGSLHAGNYSEDGATETNFINPRESLRYRVDFGLFYKENNDIRNLSIKGKLFDHAIKSTKDLGKIIYKRQGKETSFFVDSYGFLKSYFKLNLQDSGFGSYKLDLNGDLIKKELFLTARDIIMGLKNKGRIKKKEVNGPQLETSTPSITTLQIEAKVSRIEPNDNSYIQNVISKIIIDKNFIEEFYIMADFDYKSHDYEKFLHSIHQDKNTTGKILAVSEEFNPGHVTISIDNVGALISCISNSSKNFAGGKLSLDFSQDYSYDVNGNIKIIDTEFLMPTFIGTQTVNAKIVTADFKYLYDNNEFEFSKLKLDTNKFINATSDGRVFLDDGSFQAAGSFSLATSIKQHAANLPIIGPAFAATPGLGKLTSVKYTARGNIYKGELDIEVSKQRMIVPLAATTGSVFGTLLLLGLL